MTDDSYRKESLTTDTLLARLEAATEGSGSLDAAIRAAVFGGCPHEHVKGVWYDDMPTGLMCSDCGKESHQWPNIPRFTTSLDAALTLVPDSCLDDISLDLGLGEWSQKASGLPPCMVMLATGQLQNPKTRQHIGRSKRPALALCIAALKARGHE